MICKLVPYSGYSAFWDSQGSVYAFSPVHLSLSDDQDTGLKQKKPADCNRAEVPHARNLIDRKELSHSSPMDSAATGEVPAYMIHFLLRRLNRY
jgi:hypothetical protein